ncbi:MAG TPA: polysaccharide pyruvyl transferase family protein [Nitrospirota bacterium]|nr:polysaccharide pyruvyl transferase family protein [Nitrospirota bacterium]
MKILLLGATFSTRNMGVGALTAGAIQAALQHYPRAEIYLLDYGKESARYELPMNGRTVTVNLVNMRFSKKFYLKNNIALLILLSWILRLVPFRSIREKIIAGNTCLARTREANIVAALSGGDSFSDIYGLGRFLYVALPQLFVLSMGKDLVLLPQTIGPFQTAIAKRIAAYIISRSRLVYSRDYDGMEETRKLSGALGTPDKVRFCYDVGFVIDPVKPAKIEIGDGPNEKQANAPLVGLNVSGLLYRGGYTGHNMFGLRVDYRALVDELIEFFIKKKNSLVLLVPHVYGVGEASESDAAVCRKIYDAGRTVYPERLFMARGEHDQHEIKYIIGLCDFFVGSRMHACIAALSQNVPAVGIAYSRKFIGVLRTVGAEALVADPRKHGKGEIVSLINTAFEDRGQIRRRLQQRMPQVRGKVLSLFKEMEEIMRP